MRSLGFAAIHNLPRFPSLCFGGEGYAGCDVGGDFTWNTQVGGSPPVRNLRDAPGQTHVAPRLDLLRGADRVPDAHVVQMAGVFVLIAEPRQDGALLLERNQSGEGI